MLVLQVLHLIKNWYNIIKMSSWQFLYQNFWKSVFYQNYLKECELLIKHKLKKYQIIYLKIKIKPLL